MLREDQIRRYGMFGGIALIVVLFLYVWISYLTFHPVAVKAADGKQVLYDFDVFWTGIKGVFYGLIVGGITFYTAWKLNL